jgi:hypothetical protein
MMVNIGMERLEAAAYHGAKNSTSIRGVFLTESSKVVAVSFKTSEATSEGASVVSPSAKTKDARMSANAGERSAERRMTVRKKESGVASQMIKFGVYKLGCGLTCHPLSLKKTTNAVTYQSNQSFVTCSLKRNRYICYLIIVTTTTVPQDQNHSLVFYRYYIVSLLLEILEAEENRQPERCALQQWEVAKVL